MTGLLEIREKIKLFYSKFEAILLPVAKFLLAFFALNILNNRMGYMAMLDNIAIVLIVALSCSFLPVRFMVLFCALFSVAHIYSLSMEVAAVALAVYVILFLLYFRFSPKDSLIVVLVPLLFAFKIPYVIPIAVGLIWPPTSVVSMTCGIIIYYLLETVSGNAQAIKTLGDSEATSKIRLIIDGIVGNKSMLVVIAAFSVTVLVVYLIRRLQIDYSWTVALLAGAMTNVVLLLVGDLLYDINISLAGALFGSVFAILIGAVVQFLLFCVDYSRTEKVQFEDDEYYYYVKAVPKLSVARSAKTVKRINTPQPRSTTVPASRTPVRGTERSMSGMERTARSSERVVSSERTVPGGSSAYGTPTRNVPRGEVRNVGRSVTVGNTSQTNEDDDYDDIF